MRKDQSEAQTAGGSAAGASYSQSVEMDSKNLREQAVRCRRLADSLGDRATVASLHAMADEYEARAAMRERLQPTAE